MSGSPPARAAAPLAPLPPGLLPHKITIVKGGEGGKGVLAVPLGLGLVRGQVAPPPSAAAASARPLPPTVRLVAPHLHHAPHHRQPATSGSASASGKQLTSYHVPRGPATVANLSAPRVAAAPRAPASSTTPGWSTTSAQLRPGAVVYAPRPNRPHALQVTAAPKPATLRPALPPAGTPTTVVARAVRPAGAPSPQRMSLSQALQTVTSIRATAIPKVVPLVQRNYQSTAKVVGVTLGVQPGASPRTASGAYYYEVSGGVNNVAQSSNASAVVSSLPLSTSVHSLPVSILPSHAAVTAFAACNAPNPNDAGGPPGPQRPSILRKRDNEGSPAKAQWPSSSPPPSPGGSTTVSAASSPEPDDEAPSPPPPAPPPVLPQQQQQHLSDCSPRKKPRKQLLSSEARGARGSADCEFPSEGVRADAAPTPPPVSLPPPAPAPPEAEKPPRRAMLGAGWTCGWRANSLHFLRPGDVKRREERRPSVVELAAQKRVLQKANGWKIHHLTAQMDDLIELESGVLEQARRALRAVEGRDRPDLHRVCELLKGNIQRSQIVCGGVAEARTNVMRVFLHKTRVSDILARQADKRCFKKHRNHY